MVAEHRYARVTKKDDIPEDVRTDGKDDAAEIIQERIDSGDWPVQLTELADETDWSRSHYNNTLDDYFESVDETNQENETTHDHDTQQARKSITIPEDVDEMSYLRGYIAARKE